MRATTNLGNIVRIQLPNIRLYVRFSRLPVAIRAGTLGRLCRRMLEYAAQVVVCGAVTNSLEELDRRIEILRDEVRRALMAGDTVRANQVRVELRRVERAWHDAIDAVAAPDDAAKAAGPLGSILSVRDQVHQALTLLGVPSAPKMVVAVQDVFFAGELSSEKVRHLRRDEERSFRSSPHARPYYLCSALTADRLIAARGLLAVSTWPISRRIVGPLSGRVDFLTGAIHVAEQVGRMSEPTLPAKRLLRRFATSIPSAGDSFDALDPATVAEAARTELAVHQDDDQVQRDVAAERATSQLDERQQLFGSTLTVVSQSTTER
ncbi:hypothetical protein ACQP1G_38200 [Nocardia sp. CA-107356]|uniref:hypothetical protein n=1 Tax=Nocardia sp. CA-107356 TaxID=3239972 RepID=UPI003D8CBDAE